MWRSCSIETDRSLTGFASEDIAMFGLRAHLTVTSNGLSR